MRESAQHVIDFYLHATVEYIAKLTTNLPSGAIATLESEHELRDWERAMERAALAGETLTTRDAGREWCRAWKRAAGKYRG
jgi:hypothetical protein